MLGPVTTSFGPEDTARRLDLGKSPVPKIEMEVGETGEGLELT